jgi:hypothetical protein
LVDPIGPISFVAANRKGPGDALAFLVEEALVGSFEQLVENRRLMRLASGEMEVEWQSIAVTQDMDFCGKTAARTA